MQGWLLLERLALQILLFTLVDVGCTATKIAAEICKKEPLSAHALILLQVRHSAEPAGARNRSNIAKMVAKEEAQLDAMAAEMMIAQDGTTPAFSDQIDLPHSGFQAAPGEYETRLDGTPALEGGANHMLLGTSHQFAPMSFSQTTAAVVTAAPPGVATSISSGDQAGVDSCSPSCEHGHGLCRNGICLCRTPYIGATCRDVDLRAIRHLAALRSVKVLTSDPATAFLLLEDVPLLLATLAVTLCVVAAVLLATFFAHVYFKINEKGDDVFGGEEALAQEDFHEAWWHAKKKQKDLS